MIFNNQRICVCLARSLVIPQGKFTAATNLQTKSPNRDVKMCKKNNPCLNTYRNINHISSEQALTIDINEVFHPLCRACKQVLISLIDKKRLRHWIEYNNISKTLYEDFEPETMAKYFDYRINVIKDRNFQFDPHLSNISGGIYLPGVKNDGMRKLPRGLSRNNSSIHFNGVSAPETLFTVDASTGEESVDYDDLEDSGLMEDESEFLKLPKPKISSNTYNEDDWFVRMEKPHHDVNDNSEYVVPYCPKHVLLCNHNNVTLNPSSQPKNQNWDENTAQKMYTLFMKPKSPDVIFPHFKLPNDIIKYCIYHFGVENETKDKITEEIDEIDYSEYE